MARKPVAALLILLLLAPSGAADETARLIEKAIAGAKNDVDRAERLLAAAADLADRPKAQEAVYNEAVKYGSTTPQGCPHALSAIEALIELVPDRADELRAQRLTVMRLRYRGVTGAATRRTSPRSSSPHRPGPCSIRNW